MFPRLLGRRSIGFWILARILAHHEQSRDDPVAKSPHVGTVNVVAAIIFLEIGRWVRKGVGKVGRLWRRLYPVREFRSN